MRNHRMIPYSGAVVRGRHPRLRTRLVTLAVSTVVASAGVTTISAMTMAAQASAGDTMLYVANIDGGLATVDATNGTQTYDENAVGGIPVQLTVGSNGSLLYEVDMMDDYVGALSTINDAGATGASVCDRPEAESLDASSGTLYVTCNSSNGGSDAEVDVVNVDNLNQFTVTARIPFSTEPGNLLADASNGILYVNDAYGIAEVSIASNSIVGTIYVPTGALTLSPNGLVLYDSTGTDVYGISTVLASPFEGVSVSGGAGSSVICQNGQSLFTSGSYTSEISIGGSGFAVVKTFPVSGWGLSLSPDCSTLYEVVGNNVEAINTSSGAISTVYQGGAQDVTAFTVGVAPPRLIYVPHPRV